MEDLKFHIRSDRSNSIFTTISYNSKCEKLCECKVTVNNNHDIWTISSWYTTKRNSHKGYGKETLKFDLKEIYRLFGQPKIIEYIWNGSNKYVLDWLERNFDAVSQSPIAVQKYNFEDDWNSHIYILDRDKFMKYFDLK